jgi:hypothetical protein
VRGKAREDLLLAQYHCAPVVFDDLPLVQALECIVAVCVPLVLDEVHRTEGSLAHDLRHLQTGCITSIFFLPSAAVDTGLTGQCSKGQEHMHANTQGDLW